MLIRRGSRFEESKLVASYPLKGSSLTDHWKIVPLLRGWQFFHTNSKRVYIIEQIFLKHLLKSSKNFFLIILTAALNKGFSIEASNSFHKKVKSFLWIQTHPEPHIKEEAFRCISINTFLKIFHQRLKHSSASLSPRNSVGVKLLTNVGNQKGRNDRTWCINSNYHVGVHGLEPDGYHCWIGWAAEDPRIFLCDVEKIVTCDSVNDKSNILNHLFNGEVLQVFSSKGLLGAKRERVAKIPRLKSNLSCFHLFANWFQIGCPLGSIGGHQWGQA